MNPRKKAAQEILRRAQNESGTGGHISNSVSGVDVFVPTDSAFPQASLQELRFAQVDAGRSTPDDYIDATYLRGRDLNPANYLRSVYRNVPGGKEEAVRIANASRAKAGRELIDEAKLERPIKTLWRSNLAMSNPGAYNNEKDRIALASELPDAKSRAKVARHELDHAINRNADSGSWWGSGENDIQTTGPGSSQSMFANPPNLSAMPIKDKITMAVFSPALLAGEGLNFAYEGMQRAFNNGRLPQQTKTQGATEAYPYIDQYYGREGEAQAEFLAPIKHWGAEQGILPKTEQEAEDLARKYMKQHGYDKMPVGEGDDLESRRPAIFRRLMRKRPWAQLLQVVQSDRSGDSMEEV